VLDLLICARMGDRDLVHLDVVVITKIQEPFPNELGVIVSVDGVGDPEVENNILVSWFVTII
jgi:hypothetical protein